MITWPDELVEDLARRKAVLFLGAGVSKNAVNSKNERPMDWKQFLTHVTTLVPSGDKRDTVNACIKDGDYLTACELAKRYLKPDVFKTRLYAEYSDKMFVPGKIHEDIIALDSRLVLTTNFDKLYETKANQLKLSSVIVKSYNEPGVADILRRTQRVVVKVHGTIDSFDHVIFTRKAYAQARTTHALFYEILRALFLTHTFIFLGVSMKDPDIQLLLEDNSYRFPGTRPHFVVTPMGEIAEGVLEIMEESMNLRPILYDPVNYHAELAAGIGSLVPLVAAERDALTTTLEW